MTPVHTAQSSHIAIIGMSCIFPAADDLQGYWRLLLRGEDAITEVPASHWRREDYLDPEGRKADHLYCSRGGYIAPVNFDPAEFGIPPANLEATDTSQLLGLVTAKAALEDAGYGPQREFERRRASVILGVTGTQELVIPLAARLGHPLWRRALSASGLDAMQVQEAVTRIAAEYVPWQENSFPGLLGNVVAGRISNRLDLGGTNCVVDAACASSFSALHLAIMELESGNSDLVITGGVDTLNDVFMHACFCEAHILSPTGNIRPFDAQADGTLLGEGLGMLVLKRLEDARRDGDQIYAVIKGLGTSSDGRSGSIYAPRREGQAAALRAAYARAQVDPASVELLEAHGTGTRVGDQVEFSALCDVFGSGKAADGVIPWCALGSVKSMIGHTKAAAGTAGLMKAVLALHHKVLPPTLKVEAPDPRLNLEQSPFYLNTRARPWLASSGHPRRAGVSAFGFGGSNFHVVVEEYQADKSATAWSGAVQLLPFGAQTRTDLRANLQQQLQNVAPDMAAAALAAWAAGTRREFVPGNPHRLVMVVEKPIDPQTSLPGVVRQALSRALAWLEDPDGLPAPAHTFYASGAPAPLALLFPGQGSQYVGMGADLAAVFPAVLQTLQQMDACCEAAGRTPVGPLIFPSPPGSGAPEQVPAQAQEQALRQTDCAQPAIGAISLAMLEILRAFGLETQACCGHSYGELTALYAGGVLDQDTFWKLSLARGHCMATAANNNGAGTMLAVAAPLDKLDELAERVRGQALEAVLANRNAPRQGIFSGTRKAIARIEALCREKGYATRLLPVAGAFHSALMLPARQSFENALADCYFRPPVRPVVSSVTGAPLPTETEALRALLATQLTAPVDFVAAINALYQSGIRTFVEVGPKAVLTNLTGLILADRPHQALALDRTNGRPAENGRGVMDLACLLGRLAAAGHALKLEQWEPQTHATPRQPRMQIPLCGANYRSPQPARAPVSRSSAVWEREPASDLHPMSELNPELNLELNPEPVEAIPSPQSSENHPSAAPHVSPTVQQQSYTPGIEAEPMNTTDPHAPHVSTPAAASNSDLNTALQTVQEGLQSLQSLQRQTAETHQMFLQHQTESSRTLQQMVAGIQRLAENALGLAPTALPAFTETPAPLSPPAPRTHTMATPAAATHNTLAPTQTAAGGRHNDLPGTSPMVIPPTQMPPQVPLQVPSQPASPAPPLPGNDCHCTSGVVSGVPSGVHRELPRTPADPPTAASEIADHLLAVVSELTGYPVPMLELDMDIEADLGIDSIKRVEILSALEERLPQLPPVSPEIMGTLKTLRQILQQFENSGSPPGGGVPKTPDATVSAQPLAVDADCLAQNLLLVVSELTGYPVEMLELDMDIEADLGIDSIKRVEILSALEERLPQLPPVSPEIMGTLKTLQQILDSFAVGDNPSVSAVSACVPVDMPGDAPAAQKNSAVSACPAPVACANNSGANTSGASAASGPAASPVTLIRQTLQPQKTAQPAGAEITLADGATVYVAGHDALLSQSIVAALSRRGIPAAWLNMRAASDESQQLAAAAGLVIVAQAPKAASAAIPHTDEPNPAGADFLLTAFELVQQIAPHLPTTGLLAAVTRLDGAFGFLPPQTENSEQEALPSLGCPWSGGLAGLIKTAAQEWPHLTCRVLDLDPAWAPHDDLRSDALVTALLSNPSALPLEVGLDTRLAASEVWTLELADAPLTSFNPADIKELPGLQDGDVVLVSGGARGVTAAAMQALAAACHPHLILLGRSPEPFAEPDWLRAASNEADLKQALLENAFGDTAPTPRTLEAEFRRYGHNREIQRNLADLRAGGVTVTYYSVDIRDRVQVNTIVAQVREKHGPIKAVVHGAGVLADRRIEDKTAAQFREVFGTKVQGLEALLEATRNDALTWLIGFSSVAARFGNVGQVDYAMANEVMNKMLQQEARRRPACYVRSINWGPWDSGMVTAALKQAFERRNVALIPLADGARALVAEMANAADGQPVEVVISGAAPPAASALTLTFKREIDVTDVPVLQSHQLNNVPVVPLALIAEWLSHGALHQHPGLILQGLDDLRVLKGLRLDKPRRMIRIMAGQAGRKANLYEVPVELRDGVKHDQELVHTRARAILGDSLPEAPVFDYSPYSSAPPCTRRLEEIYADVLFHGEALQGIREIISLTPKFMVARIAAAPPPASWMTNPLRSRWVADPLVLDGAFQMAIIWCYDQQGKLSLPSFAARYRQYCRHFPKQDVTVVLDVIRAEQHKFTGDFTFLNRERQVLARLEGYEAVMDDSLKQAFGKSGVEGERAAFQQQAL